MRSIALTLAISVTGCSFALVSGPPPNHQQLPYFECTDNRVGPVLDTIWTALQTGNLILAGSRTDQQWSDTFNGNPPISRSSAIPLYAVLAGLGAAGMYFGFSRTAECREAKAELAGRTQQALPVRPQGTWPPPASPAPVAPAAPAPVAPSPVAPAPAPY